MKIQWQVTTGSSVMAAQQIAFLATSAPGSQGVMPDSAPEKVPMAEQTAEVITTVWS